MDKLYAMLRQAEETEALARKLTEEAGLALPDAPSSEIRKCSDQSNAMFLFEKSWELYQQVEAQIRMQLDDMDSEESNLLLAQTLLDIHIHPNSGLKRDTPALWESQYLWLKLYYQTRNEAYLEKAKLCDGIRNACVEKIEQEDNQ
ncbi:MAG: hypothetical protein ACC608_01925 [Anaerofustis sp.]